MGFFDKIFRSNDQENNEPKAESQEGEGGGVDFDIDTSEFEKRDPEMIRANVDESGELGRPRVLSEETIGQEISGGEDENAFLDNIIDNVVSDATPLGRLLAPYEDLKQQLRNRLSSELQNLRHSNRSALKGEEMSQDEMREALLKNGIDIANEIFDANKKRIEDDLDNQNRRAA